MKKQSKLACTLLILCTTFAWTGCSDDDNPIRNTPTPEPEVSKDLSLAWRDPIAADSAALLVSGENDTLVVRATNATALTLNEAAEGWKAVVKDDSLVIVTAPDDVKGADKFDLTLTATGEGDKTLTLKAAFRRILFDDPKGVFVLNEGNMSNETGTLLYITPEGELIDSIYARVNGSLLGNVTQDMKFYGDNVYFISQNGNKAPLGGEFQADGMLIIANRHTMKRVQAFTHEEMKDLKWPTHIAVVDENTIFIRDNKGVWKFNPTSKELTFMEGSEKAVKQPFVVLQGKAFTFSTLQSGVSMSLLSFDAASTKATKVSVGYDFKKLNAIGYRDENSLYVQECSTTCNNPTCAATTSTATGSTETGSCTSAHPSSRGTALPAPGSRPRTMRCTTWPAQCSATSPTKRVRSSSPRRKDRTMTPRPSRLAMRTSCSTSMTWATMPASSTTALPSTP